MVTGQIKFKEKKSEASFLSLSEKEKKEFQSDLAEVMRKLKFEMDKAKFYESKIVANQRFSTNRYFKKVAWFDLTPNQSPFIFIEEFTELEIDDYLDSINEAKNLNNSGFIKL